jgi:type IV/VI secretion system ImpK/VasF family protein
MNDNRSDYVTKLYRLASPLFLYLVSFRRKISKGYSVGLDAAREDLDEIFLEMEREVKNDFRLEGLYQEAKYPLVVVADEVLLHSRWENGDEWQRPEHLLEERIFHTNIGGEKIFKEASRLKDHQAELAVVYFTALSLGTFSRKRDQLPEVKNKLYRQLTEYLVDVKEDKLTPGAYPVGPRDTVRFSPAVTLLRVLAVGLGLTVLYWGAARLAWGHLVADLRELVATLV